MTIPQPAAVPAPPPPPVYTPPPGSRAEDLMDRLEAAKARAADAKRAKDEADEMVKTIKAAIANEVTHAIRFDPENKVADIAGTAYRPVFRLRWVTPTKINRDRLEQYHPDAYKDCLEWSTPYWDLRKAGS